MPRGPVTLADRGQAHTLEAVSASILLLASIVFALQVTAVTPLTASTASQHIENQQAGVAEGLLDAAADNGTLKSTVLLWNTSKSWYYGTSNTYSIGGPPSTFGASLNETFVDRGIAIDVTFIYVSAGGGNVNRLDIVNFGTASDHAVTVTRTVTLYDDDHLYYPNGTRQDVTLGETAHRIPDAYDGPVYNVVQVELTIWRM